MVALGSTAIAQRESERRSTAPLTTIGLDYTYSTFGGTIDPWHLAAGSLGWRVPQGTFIGRINFANRFDVSGRQYEIDAYPTLGKGRYAYLNAGYSRATIFPEQRYGAEYFTLLPRAYEASIGVRNLRFQNEQVTLLTGSIGRYIGNYWLALRPYVTQREASGLTASASLSARRYFADADTYIGARVGAGSAPTETLDPSQLAREKSITFGLQASRPASPRAITTWLFNYERDKNPIRALNRLEFGVGLKIRL
jgi:YaiO family outer membrane protein